MATSHKRPLHIVSWNVAGLKTTTESMLKSYGASDGCIASWMRRAEIDVLAVQETKVSKSIVELDTRINGKEGKLEAFFAIPKGNSGFNGVCVFVRDSTLVRRASREFGAFTDDGRFIEVELTGGVVLFNTYVHNDAGDDTVDAKMRFLLLLRQRMAAARASGKRVIACGDFNLKARARDASITRRNVSLVELMNTAPQPGEPKLLSELRERLRNGGLDAFKRELREVKAEQPVATLVFWWRGKRVVEEKRNTKQARLTPEELVAACEWTKLDAWLVRNTLSADSVPVDMVARGALTRDASHWVAMDADTIRMDALIGMLRAGALSWTEPITDADVTAFANCDLPFLGAGLKCSTVWAQSIVAELELVDSFAHEHGAALNRFTCWDQYHNRRYRNEGSRLDYIFVDGRIERAPLAPLFGCACRRAGQPRGGCQLPAQCAYDSESALRAATNYGQYKAVSMDGGGLEMASVAVMDAMFECFGSGMITTPPTWSDHIAVDVTILLGDEQGDKQQQSESARVSDAEMRACQPHAQMRSITDLFKRQSAESLGGGGVKRAEPPAPAVGEANAAGAAAPKRSHSDASATNKPKEVKRIDPFAAMIAAAARKKQ